jgi:Ulp1 family protease
LTETEIKDYYSKNVDKLLSECNDGQIVITNQKANYTVSKKSLMGLKPGKWLNDEVINAYVSLINERDKESGKH